MPKEFDFNFKPRAPTFDESKLDKKQKSVHEFMTRHPFEETPQAPSVDIQMIRDLGSARKKTMLGENQWEVTYESGTKYTGTIELEQSSKNYEQPIYSGHFQFPNGDVYEGSVGVRAAGTYTHSNGVKYKGQFYRLMKSGTGVQSFPSGDTYTGMFKNTLYHGTGKDEYVTGDDYQGTFAHGKREHIGTYIYPSGEKVVGDWENDQLHGTGQYEFTNGIKIKNAFVGSRIKL